MRSLTSIVLACTLAGCSSTIDKKEELTPQQIQTIEDRLKPKKEEQKVEVERKPTEQELYMRAPKDFRFYELPQVISKARKFVEDWDAQGFLDYVNQNARFLFDIVQLRTGEEFNPELYMNFATKVSLLFGSRNYFIHTKTEFLTVDWVVHVAGHEFDPRTESSRYYESTRHALRSEVIVELFRWMMYQEVADKYDRLVGLEHINSMIERTKREPVSVQHSDFIAWLAQDQGPLGERHASVNNAAPVIAAMLIADDSSDYKTLWNRYRAMNEEDFFAALGHIDAPRVARTVEALGKRYEGALKERDTFRKYKAVDEIEQRLRPNIDALVANRYDIFIGPAQTELIPHNNGDFKPEDAALESLYLDRIEFTIPFYTANSWYHDERVELRLTPEGYVLDIPVAHKWSEMSLDNAGFISDWCKRMTPKGLQAALEKRITEVTSKDIEKYVKSLPVEGFVLDPQEKIRSIEGLEGEYKQFEIQAPEQIGIYLKYCIDAEPPSDRMLVIDCYETNINFTDIVFPIVSGKIQKPKRMNELEYAYGLESTGAPLKPVERALLRFYEATMDKLGSVDFSMYDALN